MATSLNTSVPGRDIGYQVEQILYRVLTNTDTTAVSLGGLPASAVITGGQITTTTAFTGTTPVISVGYTDATGSNLTAYASAQSVGTAGTAVMDDILTTTALPLSRATNVVASITGTSMTTGACAVVLRYVANNPAA